MTYEDMLKAKTIVHVEGMIARHMDGVVFDQRAISYFLGMLV